MIPYPMSVRQIATDILCRVEEGAHADRLLESDARVARLSAVDASLLRELVRGVLAWRDHLDVLLAPYLRKPLADTQPVLRTLLRLGAYQMRFLDRIPAYAAVSESVDLARAATGDPPARMVNAVLRGIAEDRRPARFPAPGGDPAAHIAATLSHPKWLVERWIRQWGFEETKRLCEVNNGTLPIGLRVNPGVAAPGDLLKELRDAGVEVAAAPWPEGFLTVRRAGPLFQTAAYQRGAFSVHGHGAALALELLGVRPGDSVLDVCSAPGGKTVGIAQALGGSGSVIAIDLLPVRLRLSRRNTRRLRLKGIRFAVADGCRLPLRGTFDNVLVDAPCSATGIISRHPEIRWHRQPKDIPHLAALQLKLLGSAAPCVAKGGAIVYSTCSLETEENQGVVGRFLADHPDFEVDPPGDRFPESVRAPLGEKSAACVQTFPHRHGCDGAFAVRLRRI